MNKIQNVLFRCRSMFYRFCREMKITKSRPFIDQKSSVARTFYDKKVVSGEEGNKLILDALSKSDPCMVGRIGTIEMGAFQAWLDKKSGLISKVGDKRIALLCNNAGFFPNTEESVDRFGKIYLNAIQELDLFGVFGEHAEDFVANKIAKKAKLMQISALGPYYFSPPWSSGLKGKKILVVHPFDRSIEKQYRVREQLFDDNDVLPEFDLITLRAVQTIGGNTGGFSSWFEALDYMKNRIAEIDFDVAIIGCGAYGLPLAAYVKQLGKKSILMAGATQLLFGIKGARWDNAPITSKYYKETWIRPCEEERPKNSETVEGGCYW